MSESPDAADTMRLFDCGPSTETGPARYGEFHWEYLCRTGRKPFGRIRGLMENWFAQYPPIHRAELGRRLRDSDNRVFKAAFFELYLHALFLRLGYKIEVHPAIGDRGRHPDFLVKMGEVEIVLEASCVEEFSQSERGSQTRREDVYNLLNQVECKGYRLKVDFIRDSGTALNGRRLRRELCAFISAQDYHAAFAAMVRGGMEGLPKCSFVDGDTRLEITLIPGSQRGAGGRPVGMTGVEGGWVDERTPIRDKVRRKAGRYGQLGKPLLVAINVLASAADRSDVVDAMFGAECYTFTRTDGGHTHLQPRRAPDGVWYGPSGPQYRRLCGVLVTFGLLPWTVTSHRAAPLVYHNPWAQYPLTSLPADVTQFRVEEDRLVPTEGRCPHELIGVEPGWPHFNEED